jgi:transcriptional regulator with XRE-family HTH domain
VTDTTTLPTVGALLRDWRERRRLSQLGLALEAGVSARHVSFLETGRSRPSQEMLLRLAEELEVPLRERNRMLLAAGYAPAYGQGELGAPQLEPVREAIELILRGHEPYPALVVDRHWELVAANSALGVLTEGIAAHLLEPPVNVLRASLHPDGAAPRIVNLGRWRAHVLDRVGRQAVATGDPALAALHEELSALPGGREEAHGPGPEIAVPLRIRAAGRVLSFISTIATFGTATDVTVSELAIESFFPVDDLTAQALRGRAAD